MDNTNDPPSNAEELERADQLYQKGLAFNEDSSVPINSSQAIPFLREAAELGHLEAQFKLGLRYYGDFSTFMSLLDPSFKVPYELENGANQIESYNWFKKAAEKGHPQAMYYLSECLKEGIGVRANLSNSIECLKEAAKKGDSAAQLKLGEYYVDGTKIPKDSALAIEWLLKAAEQESLGAYLALADLYHEGVDVARNDEEAAAWWNKAALLGSSPAMKFLGLAYQRGEGVPLDLEKAVEWFQKAANCQDPDPQAFFLLGLSFLSGKGVGKSSSQAFKYITESAERGYPLGLYALGELYQNGIGTESNPKMAHKFMRFATIAGDETIVDAVQDFIKRENLE